MQSTNPDAMTCMPKPGAMLAHLVGVLSDYAILQGGGLGCREPELSGRRGVLCDPPPDHPLAARPPCPPPAPGAPIARIRPAIPDRRLT